MFIKLFSIEWTRLTRRSLFWISLAVCAVFTWLGLENFYTLNQSQLLSGTLKMPGFSFDLANSLDQVFLVALPFLVIISAVMLGNDYSQRTNQHWLMRASRPTSLLAKFALLALFALLVNILTVLVGGATGWYYKTFIYQTFSLANVNWPAALAAPFYMTLTSLPYLALMLLITVATRSAFAGAAIGLGYTQFVELLMGGIFYGMHWTKWMPRSLYLSATYLLNSIGNRTVTWRPEYVLAPIPAFITAALYTLIFLAAALWLYRRQDLGG
jgi:hypothetical protein